MFYAVGDSTYVFRGFSQVGDGGGVWVYIWVEHPPRFIQFSPRSSNILKGTVQQDFRPTGFFLI